MKRRNCLLQAISPFLTMFSTAIYLKERQNVVMRRYGDQHLLFSPKTVLKVFFSQSKLNSGFFGRW